MGWVLRAETQGLQESVDVMAPGGERPVLLSPKAPSNLAHDDFMCVLPNTQSGLLSALMSSR